MNFGQPFDARGVDPTNVFAPLPLGDYKVMIVGTEAKENSAKTGGYLELTLRILDGQYINREIPYRLNLWNPSQQSCEIAYKQLSAICHVTGVFVVNDSQQLHLIPFVATIGPQRNDPQYSEVKGVKDLNGNTPGKPNTGTAVAAAAPAPQPAAAPAPQGWGPPAATPPPQAAPAPAPAPAVAPAWGQPQPAAPVAAQPPAAAPWQPGAPASPAPPWAQK